MKVQANIVRQKLTLSGSLRPRAGDNMPAKDRQQLITKRLSRVNAIIERRQLVHTQ
jgi:hypothetical protein